MVDPDFDNPWIFTGVTVAIWVLVFVAIQVVIFDNSLMSGAVQGFLGGLAYSIAVKIIQRFQEKE
jgi:membrane associated rhomboid family serine protease